MEKYIKHLQIVDYLVAAGSLGYGLATHSALWIAGGALGMGLAKFNVAKKLSAVVQAKFKKRQPVAVTPLLEDESTIAASPIVEQAVTTSSYRRALLTNGERVTSTSRHSLLKGPQALNHAE
jgi:hypothetical protein